MTHPPAKTRVSLFPRCGTGGFAFKKRRDGKPFRSYFKKRRKKERNFLIFFNLGRRKQLPQNEKCDILYKQLDWRPYGQAVKLKWWRPYGQAVKTTPSHGVNSGSSPDKVTTMPPNRVAFFVGDLIGKGDEPEGFARGHSPKLSERSPLAEYRRYPMPTNVTLWGGVFRWWPYREDDVKFLKKYKKNWASPRYTVRQRTYVQAQSLYNLSVIILLYAKNNTVSIINNKIFEKIIMEKVLVFLNTIKARGSTAN